MSASRRAFALGLAAAITACKRNGGPGGVPGPSPSPSSSDPLARGARWLASRQGADGAWISEVYGAFKDGHSLTPLATVALLESGFELEAAGRGVGWLRARAKDGGLDFGRVTPAYPAYTAALATRALSHGHTGGATARDAFLAELRRRQLTEALGWSVADAHYGGWGYATAIPRKPAPGGEIQDAFLESNLSATAFALDALAAAGVPATDPAFAKARVFVERQQNADGGFFFMPEDEVRNKAGLADEKARTFHSYGSMTADGLRALLRCGGSAERVARAHAWLKSRFEAAHHPGTYRPEREETRDSPWFYWAASLAQSLRLHGGEVSWWSEPLRDELARRQRPDGSWLNELIAVREDDPVVATSFALLALAAIRG